jgi:hypothetical protein
MADSFHGNGKSGDVKMDDMAVQGVTPVLVGLGFAMVASLLSLNSRPLLENAKCQSSKSQ